MCGIAGILNINGEPVALTAIRSMADAMSHRGPDGDGLFVENNLALGHKRLAILDVSPMGAQPMASKNGEWIIVFNGCIYNYLELKLELQSLGHFFTSRTDTEIIVEGLAEYGSSFFERLNGMFAVGAWSKKTGDLYLSRDRFGIKPLYYWFNGKTILFASEIKSFMKHADFKVNINLDALNEYFSFQNLFSYQTLFQGVFMLPPANTVRINKDISYVKHQSWWDYDFSEPDDRMTFEDARLETEKLFKNAVARQMISDVPVGSYLSGGMDSGSITAVASTHVKRLATFTAGFDMSEVSGGKTNYDERRDAELMANHFKTEHYEQTIKAGNLS